MPYYTSLRFYHKTSRIANITSLEGDLDRVALVGRRILDGFGVRFGRRKRADRQAERQHQRRPADDFFHK